MTEIEAIKRLEGWQDGTMRHCFSWEAGAIALAALREKQEREKGCEYCSWERANGKRKTPIMLDAVLADNGRFVSNCQHCGGGKVSTFVYCPMCGRRLEVKQDG